MTVYCKKCLKSFKHPYLLKRHMQKKNSCDDQMGKNIDFVCETFEKQIDCNKTVNDTISILKNQISELQEKCNELEETKEKVSLIEEELYNNTQRDTITCQYCLKQFSRIDNLTKHLQQQRCKNKIENISIYERELNMHIDENVYDNKLSCRFCNTTFSTKQSYSRHKNRGCKEKYQYEINLQERVLKNRKEAAIHNITNNTTTNNVTNNITVNLPPMRAFGKENHDYITTKSLLKELQNCSSINDLGGIIGNFTKLVYANPAHPENHNVLFRSLTGGYAQVYNGAKFESRHTLEVQDKILQDIGSLVQDRIDNSYQSDIIKEETDELFEALDSEVIFPLKNSINNENSTRKLSKYRQKVKSILHENKDEIDTTQTLIK